MGNVFENPDWIWLPREIIPVTDSDQADADPEAEGGDLYRIVC